MKPAVVHSSRVRPVRRRWLIAAFCLVGVSLISVVAWRVIRFDITEFTVSTQERQQIVQDLVRAFGYGQATVDPSALISVVDVRGGGLYADECAIRIRGIDIPTDAWAMMARPSPLPELPVEYVRDGKWPAWAMPASLRARAEELSWRDTPAIVNGVYLRVSWFYHASTREAVILFPDVHAGEVSAAAAGLSRLINQSPPHRTRYWPEIGTEYADWRVIRITP